MLSHLSWPQILLQLLPLLFFIKGTSPLNQLFTLICIDINLCSANGTCSVWLEPFVNTSCVILMQTRQYSDKLFLFEVYQANHASFFLSFFLCSCCYTVCGKLIDFNTWQSFRFYLSHLLCKVKEGLIVFTWMKFFFPCSRSWLCC